MAANVVRDERMVMVENASYKLCCIVLLFGLLLDLCYRSLVKQGALPDWLSLIESNWDLFGLVILGSGLATAYQWQHKILGHIKPRRILVSMAIAVAFVIIMRMLESLGAWG